MIPAQPSDEDLDIVAEFMTRVDEDAALRRKNAESAAAKYGPLRTTHVAEYLGVSEKQLRWLEQQDQAPTSRSDHRGRYYTREDVWALADMVLYPDRELPEDDSIVG